MAKSNPESVFLFFKYYLGYITLSGSISIGRPFVSLNELGFFDYCLAKFKANFLANINFFVPLS